MDFHEILKHETLHCFECKTDWKKTKEQSDLSNKFSR